MDVAFCQHQLDLEAQRILCRVVVGAVAAEVLVDVHLVGAIEVSQYWSLAEAACPEDDSPAPEPRRGFYRSQAVSRIRRTKRVVEEACLHIVQVEDLPSDLLSLVSDLD